MKRLECDCGAPLKVMRGGKFAYCSYCQTVYDLDRRDNIRGDGSAWYTLAAQSRKAGDFDHAIDLYNDILKKTGPEKGYKAYWGKVLCRYMARLTYSENEQRLSVQCDGCFEDIIDDVDYNNALLYGKKAGDSEFIETVTQTAGLIRGFVDRLCAYSDDPDFAPEIFLCYKTTNPDGTEAREFGIAKNIMYRLKEIGYDVFFADIRNGNHTDGYAAKIYYALKSAKLFLFCTSSWENAHSVWVTNELTTYLRFKKDDNRKNLLPILCGTNDRSILPSNFEYYPPYIISGKTDDDYNRLAVQIMTMFLPQRAKKNPAESTAPARGVTRGGRERSTRRGYEEDSTFNRTVSSGSYYEPDRSYNEPSRNTEPPATRQTGQTYSPERERKLFGRSVNKGHKAGDIVSFGRYPQNSYAPEPIAWRILDIINGSALMISESLIDCRPYNDTRDPVSWEDSTLRRWLNSEFLNTAFSADEQKRIKAVRNNNQNNLRYGADGGNITEDKVFCLSADEVERYFTDFSAESAGSTTIPDRMAKPTAMALRNGVTTGPRMDTGWWWLRSIGSSGHNAAGVDPCGGTFRDGLSTGSSIVGIRPVILASI